MDVNTIEIDTLPDELRAAVLECEVTGRKALLTRGERRVAIVLSWDEYLSLRETIELAADAGTVAAIRAADEELARGRTAGYEDLRDA